MRPRGQRLSIVVVARDEEGRVGRCLASAEIADEVIVVDTGSIDRTRAIAADAGARVIERPWRGFGPTKREALDFAQGDWVLLLDADEEITPELAEAIEAALTDDEHAGYVVTRRAFFLGRWMRHGGWYPDRVLRLVRAGRFTMSDDLVHERLTADGKVSGLDGDLLHHTDRTLDEYLAKMMAYARLGAEVLHERGVRVRVRHLVLRPAATFLKRFVFKSGFRDGLHGFLLATLSAVHVTVKYAYLWELGRAERRDVE